MIDITDSEAQNEKDFGERTVATENYSDVIPVLQEEVEIGKRVVETGKVHISKRVSEHQTDITVPVMSETYEVNRIPVNEQVTTPPPAIRYEGDTMIMSVIKEVVVVEKRYEVVEEIHITKRKTESIDTQQVTLRKEEVSIERTPASDTEASL